LAKPLTQKDNFQPEFAQPVDSPVDKPLENGGITGVKLRRT
jgi:hypothetical protein